MGLQGNHREDEGTRGAESPQVSRSASRLRPVVGSLVAFVLSGAFVGGAMAQSASSQAQAELSPSSALRDQAEESLTPAERLAKAEVFVDGIDKSAKGMMRQLEAARKERDVVRVLCLNDKLNQVDVALRSARDRLDVLRSAVERKDADRARHEFTVLDVLNDRVKVLVNESGQCVGEETGFIGEAEVSVTVDPNLPDGETDNIASTTSAPPTPPSVNSPIE